jgi:hypothetical protein
MNINVSNAGRAYFASIIVTKPDGSVDRYDPVNGSMDDMDACKALADCRAALIAESPHLREVFYGEGK